MGRTTDFFKLNAEKAKSNLILDLHSKTKFKKSFEDFLIERKAEVGNDFNVSFNNLIQKVSSNINTILPSELWELTYWLGEIYHERTKLGENSEKVDYELYINNGIEILHVLISVNAYGFMFQYGNFTDQFKVNQIIDSWSGINVNAKDFIRFLDYMILLMKKILEADLSNDSYQFSIEEIDEASKIENKNQENKLLFELIDREFNHLKENFFAEKENLENYGSRDPDYFTVLCAESFFHNCLEMKKEIEEINTNILILDSI